MEVLGQKLCFGEAFTGRDVAEDADGLAALVAEDVLVPGNLGAAVGAEEVVFVGRVVLEAELVIVFRELGGFEAFRIGLAFAAYIASAPASIEELPLAAVDPDGVPSMVSALRRKRRPAG